MSDGSSHLIVYFPVDDSVEVVPVGWLTEDRAKCYFAVANSKQVKRMVKNSLPVLPQWLAYDCRIFWEYGELI